MAAPDRPETPAQGDALRRRAFGFVVLLGFVSLFSDVTYEGARSITGPFLAMLGASGTVVGLVSGLGELAGYGLRLVSGYLADRTRRYWAMTLFGYALNLLAVPLLALAGHWPLAAALIVLERTGKAIRNPPRDVMLSHAASRTGRGFGFGLHEAMDQVGAVLGPLGAATVLSMRGDHRTAFAWLAVPAVLALATLLLARWTYPTPQDLESRRVPLSPQGLRRTYWVFLAGAALVACGYADFPLIAYRMQREALAPEAWIPGLYALAMAVDALAALVFGRLFDRRGIPVVAWAVAASALFAPLAFLGSFPWVVAGMVCWGIGMGAQESILRAAVADFAPAERRGTAYGLFNAAYGLAWFLGSALMGWLYDVSVPVLVAFSVATQVAAIPFFRSASKRLTSPA